MGPNEQFRKAVELVRSGRVGNLRRVEIGLPIDPTAPDDPQQPVPPNLNYDLWLGPTPEVYYTEQRVHPQHGERRSTASRARLAAQRELLARHDHRLGRAPLRHGALGHGHGAHRAARIEGSGEFPTNKIWNVHGEYTSSSPIPATSMSPCRTSSRTASSSSATRAGSSSRATPSQTASDPSGDGATSLKSLDASDAKLLDPKGLTVQLPSSTSHHKNWLECVQSRKQPLAPAPVAHRSNTACILSWIAMKLNRPLTWDAKAERS